MSKKRKGKITPPVYRRPPKKPALEAPKTRPDQEISTITGGQAEGWICKAAIKRVQGAGGMRDYIRIESLCTEQCEVPEALCHRVRIKVENA